MIGAPTVTNIISPETRYNVQLLIECSFRDCRRNDIVKRTECRLDRWASGSPRLLLRKDITVHGCTVRANVIRAVLISYLQLRHDDRK